MRDRDSRSAPWRRVSAVRLVVVLGLIAIAVLSFAAPLGPVRGVFRALLVVGVVVIALSYLVEAVRARRGGRR